MTSRHFCISLLVASSLFAAQASHATTLLFYLHISFENVSKQDLRFCSDDKSYCQTVKPGASLATGGHDTNESEKTLASWVHRWRLEICGKELMLEQLPSMRAFDKVVDGRDVRYTAKVTESEIEQVCSDVRD